MKTIISSAQFVLAFIFALAILTLAQETSLQKADQLYVDRDRVESLKQAIALVEKDVTNYEAMWRLAKFKYYLSDTQSDEKQKIKLMQEGISAAEKAIRLDATRAEGHFWMGAMLVLLVMFARGGVLGLADRLTGALRRPALPRTAP